MTIHFFMTEEEQAMQSLRATIDLVDERLYLALVARIELGHEMIERKIKAGLPKLDVAREAEILTRAPTPAAREAMQHLLRTIRMHYNTRRSPSSNPQ